MRLTTTKKKEPELFDGLENIDENKYFVKFQTDEPTTLECVADKLGQLEDIEEELGIDLITLFKALKNGIWVKDKGYNPSVYKIEPFELNISLRENYFIVQELYFEDLDYVMDTTGRKWFPEDYGKTWALTEGELK